MKDRVQDAIAVGDVFMVCIMLDQVACSEAHLTFRINELQQV